MICGYYLHLSISAYYLTWRLKPTNFYGLQSFSECWKTPVLSSVAFFAYKRFATKILAPYFQPYCKDQKDKAKSIARSKRAAVAFAKSFYYFLNSIWGYILLKDTDFLPSILGGSGSLKNCFENVPYQEPIDGLLKYSLISMGYYVGDLFDSLLINEASNDYWEMIMHHMLTVTLFGGMIMQNQMRVGVIVAFIHNLTDIFTSISRCSS